MFPLLSQPPQSPPGKEARGWFYKETIFLPRFWKRKVSSRPRPGGDLSPRSPPVPQFEQIGAEAKNHREERRGEGRGGEKGRKEGRGSEWEGERKRCAAAAIIIMIVISVPPHFRNSGTARKSIRKAEYVVYALLSGLCHIRQVTSHNYRTSICPSSRNPFEPRSPSPIHSIFL